MTLLMRDNENQKIGANRLRKSRKRHKRMERENKAFQQLGWGVFFLCLGGHASRHAWQADVIPAHFWPKSVIRKNRAWLHTAYWQYHIDRELVQPIASPIGRLTDRRKEKKHIMRILFNACCCRKNSDVHQPHAGNYGTAPDTDGTGELVPHSDRSLFRYYRIP